MWRHDRVEVEGEMSFRGPRMLNILLCDPCIMDLVWLPSEDQLCTYLLIPVKFSWQNFYIHLKKASVSPQQTNEITVNFTADTHTHTHINASYCKLSKARTFALNIRYFHSEVELCLTWWLHYRGFVVGFYPQALCVCVWGALMPYVNILTSVCACVCVFLRCVYVCMYVCSPWQSE